MIFEISNAGSVTKIYSNTWTPESDTWYHVAVTRKDGVFNFYLDGVSHGDDYSNKTTSVPNVDAKVYFGSLSGATNLDGQIDEFRIWNVARSVSDIATYRTENILRKNQWINW